MSEEILSLTSPNGRIQVDLICDRGKLFYRVYKDSTPIILRSSLGVVIDDDNQSAEGWNVIGEQKEVQDVWWNPVWGRSARVRDHYQQLTIEFAQEQTRNGFEPEHSVDRRMNIIFRVFNDGLGFRYEWMDSNDSERIHITKELTEFTLSGDYTCWWSDDGDSKQEMNSAGRLLSSFTEGDTPITVEVSDQLYISLHEADVENYELCTLRLKQDKPNTFICQACSTSTLPHRSPWRTLIITETTEGLSDSYLIDNLNPPCAIEDTSWIIPGKSMWDWRNRGTEVEGFTYGLNTESMIRFIDFAAEHQFQYTLIDAGWHGDEFDLASDPTKWIDEINVPWLARYAAAKGIGLWVYVNDIALKQYDLETTLSTYYNWGIVGIKHGFIQDVGQNKVDFTRKVAMTCAKYKLLYVPHEPAKPWGLHRTYPNFLSCEYINAVYDGPHRPDATPTYLCTVPFTNNLTAPLDRSSGMFDLNQAIIRDKVNKEAWNTISSQVAQCIVIHTGFLCLPDHPESYARKNDLFQVIEKLPLNWDESKMLHGRIGEYVVMARRSGEEWFVGALTNENEREMQLSLDFLPDQIQYELTLYSDGDQAHYLNQREHYQIKRKTVTNQDDISIWMASGGGFSIHAKPSIRL